MVSPCLLMAAFCISASLTALSGVTCSHLMPASMSLTRLMSLTLSALSPGSTPILHILSMATSRSASVSPIP